jgi:type IV secretory pathway ATPase VirB11/archaellum biosynthesis ATPase
VWLDRLHGGRVETGQQLPPAAAEAIIRLVAHHIGETVSEERPLIAGTLPSTGERFQGVLPPIAKAPCFTIRKRPEVIFHLDDYVEGGIMTDEQAASDVTDTLELALAASGCDRATVIHRPRLLSDNGSSYVAGDLRFREFIRKVEVVFHPQRGWTRTGAGRSGRWAAFAVPPCHDRGNARC